MRVCFILEHFYPHVGGVETEFWEFSRHLVSLGCEVRVITSDSGGATGQKCYDGVATWHHTWRGLFGHPYPREKDLIEHIVWADIVHTTTYTAAPVAARVARKIGRPCVLSVQEALGRKWFAIGENPITASLFFLFERFVISRSFQAWHCISEATARDVRATGIPSDKIFPILLGVDESLTTSPPERLNPASLFGVPLSTRVVLFFGRAGKTKGVRVLVDAIRELRGSIPKDLVFGFILGAHPPGEREKYSELIMNEGLSDHVKISPSVPRSELMAYVKGSYCVVVPSITEGFGFSAAETCALGTPIIASDAGSLPEVVSGKHLFFQNRSSPDLAKKLVAAFEGEFEERPRRFFSWADSASSLLDLYCRVSGGSAPNIAPVTERGSYAAS